MREIISEDRGGAGLTILIASSVVRGSRQGESHGGVYLVDTQRNSFEQVIDWNTPDIDWQGRGWDRGLRGIAFDGAQVFMAASNELFVYSPDFRLLASYSNPFLMHAHEIAVHERRLYLTSTGFDSVLGFDLDRREFCFGLQVQRVGGAFQARLFDPLGNRGPAASNDLHINSVFCNADGMYISGLKTACLLLLPGRQAQALGEPAARRSQCASAGRWRGVQSYRCEPAVLATAGAQAEPASPAV